VSAYAGCIFGASLLGDYLAMALGAGLSGLTIPRIDTGRELMQVLSPADICSGGASCCGSTVSITSIKNPDEIARQASEALASVKLHGKK
jgi:hypothetical protein